MKKQMLYLIACLTMALPAFVYAIDGSEILESTTASRLTGFTTDADYVTGGDMFGIRSRPDGGEKGLPYAIADDSFSIYTSDTQGMIKENDEDYFFGVVDNLNDDNSDLDSASWTFDISDMPFVSISIDFAAMGDFEADDIITVTAAIDSNPAVDVFSVVVNEDGSQEYVLEGGFSAVLEDPVVIDGVNVTNEFVTFASDLDSTGSSLILTFSALVDGGSEAFAFRNITLSSTPVSVVEVPDVSSLNRSQAEQAIISSDLAVSFVDVYSDIVPQGGFVGQVPAAGSMVPNNTVVTVSYSLGAAAEFTSFQYGWEDGELPYLTIDSDMTAEFSSETVSEGSTSVKMIKTTDSTGSMDIAQISGLNEGDQVTAVVKLKYIGTHSLGTRLWATGVNGSGGPEEGYIASDWGTQSFTWVAGDSSMNVQLRCYGKITEGEQYAYADDFQITAPGYAQITLPGTGNEVEPNIPDGGFLSWSEPDAVYGWENDGIDVGSAGEVETRNDTTESNSGNSSLKVIRGSSSGTISAYIARVAGLNEGDTIRARVMAKKGDSPGNGIRLWGHYEVDGEDDGSAGGYDTYSGTDWSSLGYEWTFEKGSSPARDTLVVDARVYGTDGYGWVDDLELWVPESATITFPEEPNDPICYLENDLTGDCTVNLADFSALAGSWMVDGYDVPDPNANDMFYKFYSYGWDDGKTAMETYPSAGWDDPNQIPGVENIVDPDNPSNRILKITSGTWYNAKIVLARIDRLQDADQIYVAVKWKDDFVDVAPSLQLAIEHHTNGNYAGGAYTRPIYSDIDWGYGASLFTFDVGDPARTGLKVVAVAADDRNPGSVCGYIDEVIVSVPYHEDEFGNDESGKVLFQLSPVESGEEFSDLDTLPEVCLANPENDIVWAGDSYCIVDVADLAALSSEWLECDWSDATLCDPAADVE